MYSELYTTNEVLERDFQRFKSDGLGSITLTLYWYRVESDRGNYDTRFLDEIKRVIGIADFYGLKVQVAIMTLWGEDSMWCTPEYVVDPLTGLNIGLAVARSDEVKQDFINMFSFTVDYLKDTEGIWCFSLNEPWYYPYDNEVKERFIRLFQEMGEISRKADIPFTIRFVGYHDDGIYESDIFPEQWNWDKRIFDAVDFISFNIYHWRDCVGYNIDRCLELEKKVYISEIGNHTDMSNLLKEVVKHDISGVMGWVWVGDTSTYDEKYNMCEGFSGIPNNLYYQLLSIGQ